MLASVQVQLHVEADPDRVMAATVSSSAIQAADDGGVFAPVHGYTTDNLLKDKRFKVIPHPGSAVSVLKSSLLSCRSCKATPTKTSNSVCLGISYSADVHRATATAACVSHAVSVRKSKCTLEHWHLLFHYTMSVLCASKRFIHGFNTSMQTSGRYIL